MLLKNEGEAELRIGTYASISTKLLPEILIDFKKRNPDIRVSITVSDMLRGWLKSGAADIIFGDEMSFEDNEHFIISEDPYMAVVPEQLFYGRRMVSLEELYPHTYISTNESNLKKYFSEDGFSDIIRLDSSDHSAVLSMIGDGIGIAVLPALAISKKNTRCQNPEALA